MEISDWDLKELKVLAYDISRQLTGLKKDLEIVNRTISIKETENATPPVPDNNSVPVPCCSTNVSDCEGCTEGDVLPSERSTES